MHRVCTEYAQSMHRVCTEYAQSMHRVCTEYAQEYAQKVCTEVGTESMHRKYAQTLANLLLSLFYFGEGGRGGGDGAPGPGQLRTLPHPNAISLKRCPELSVVLFHLERTQSRPTVRRNCPVPVRERRVSMPLALPIYGAG